MFLTLNFENGENFCSTLDNVIFFLVALIIRLFLFAQSQI